MKTGSMKNQPARQRRLKRTRTKIAELGALRLSVHRTPQHIYAQKFSPKGDQVFACASSLDKDIRAITDGDKTTVAQAVGRLVSQRAKEKGIAKVAFDRSGYKYHGRVKALAEAAREDGLDF